MTMVERTWDYTTGQWVVPVAPTWSSADFEARMSRPTSVWVALVVWTKAVAVHVRKDIPGGQVQGRMGIFANMGAVETQEVNTAEVVAVCYTQAEAEQAVADHRAATGDTGEYRMAEHQIGVARAETVQQPVSSPCIKCGATLYSGQSYCDPCRQAMFKARRESDPGDVEAVRPTSYTPPWDRTGKGSGM